MILVGIIAFYLGIDIPRLHASQVSLGARHPIPQWDTVELLGATGTFLAAVAALSRSMPLCLTRIRNRVGNLRSVAAGCSAS
jgi:hypothetical protein